MRDARDPTHGPPITVLRLREPARPGEAFALLDAVPDVGAPLDRPGDIG
jgi:hypothetical protein